VLGAETLARLKDAAGPAEAPKLDRAPTLVVASAALSGDLQQDEEDVCATACAIYVVLLAAHARGLAGYRRTPRVLRTKSARKAVSLPDGERFLGLIHLGEPWSEPPEPERAPLDAYRFVLPEPGLAGHGGAVADLRRTPNATRGFRCLHCKLFVHSSGPQSAAEPSAPS